jgi:RNA polymerase sigma factor (sigma-70 family)
MQPRQSLIELFSTFIQFSEDYFNGWVSDGQLRKNMQRHLNQLGAEKTSERFWYLFWYKQWAEESTNLARNHLSAYLQEVCYWTAQKIISRTQSLQYKLSDGFQMAIAEIEKILQGFNPQSSASLKTYASMMFKSFLTNLLRQYSEIDIATDWSLLRKLSKKRLENALENAGFPQKEIKSYLLLWNCFKTIYAPHQAKVTQQLPPPSPTTYEAIIQLYESESINQLGQKDTNLTPVKAEKILKLSAKSARSYLYPKTSSLNITPVGQDSGEIIDNLPSINPSRMMEIIAQEEELERKQQQKEIHNVLVTAINQLKPEMQTILQLYFGEGLNQNDIAQRLNAKQYQISRRLTRAKELLIKSLARWSENSFQRTLNSVTLKEMSSFIDQWLIKNYAQEY